MKQIKTIPTEHHAFYHIVIDGIAVANIMLCKYKCGSSNGDVNLWFPPTRYNHFGYESMFFPTFKSARLNAYSRFSSIAETAVDDLDIDYLEREYPLGNMP